MATAAQSTRRPGLLRGATPYFRLRQRLQMRCNVPVISPSVHGRSIPFSVELVLRLGQRCRPSRQRRAVHSIYIRNINVNGHRPRSPLAMRFAAFQHRVADLHRRMANDPVRSYLLIYDAGAKRFLEKLQQRRGPRYVQPRRHAAKALRRKRIPQSLCRSFVCRPFVRGNVPIVARWILDPTLTVAILHIPRLIERLPLNYVGTLCKTRGVYSQTITTSRTPTALLHPQIES